MKSFWRFALASLALTAAASAYADVGVTPKHLLILRPGLDSVYGSYVFAVKNDGEEPAHLKTTVMLPKETDDFAPQEGITAEELHLAPEGGVVVEKDFKKGIEIVSIGFKVPSTYGKATLTITPREDIPDLTVLVPRQSGLVATSSLLTAKDLGGAPDPQYESYANARALIANSPMTIEVAGIPEGRSRYWIVGGIVGGLLLVLGLGLAWRSRPKITGDAGQAILTS